MEFSHDQVMYFIEQNPDCVVSYHKENHVGWKNINPNRVGVIFEGNLYDIVFVGDSPGGSRPCLAVEAEGDCGYHGIEGLQKICDSNGAREYIAQEILKSLCAKRPKVNLEFGLLLTTPDGRCHNLAVSYSE